MKFLFPFFLFNFYSLLLNSVLIIERKYFDLRTKCTKIKKFECTKIHAMNLNEKRLNLIQTTFAILFLLMKRTDNIFMHVSKINFINTRSTPRSHFSR